MNRAAQLLPASFCKNIIIIGLVLVGTKGIASELTDAQIKQQIISESKMSYPGTCPCPESRARNGSRCGRRSAYSRAGGYATLCYPSDVTKEMIQRFKDRIK